MDSGIALFFIIVAIICPVLGLLLGAILPPFVWPEDRGLLTGLNIGGLIFYAPAGIMLAALMCSPPKGMGVEHIWEGVLLSFCAYLAVALFCRMLGRYVHSLKKR